MLPDRQNKVTIEELLRLKRSERPPAEFWAEFERELRQKQLTALVKRKRWWHDLSVLLHRRVAVPAGAVAIVTFSLISVRLASTNSSVSRADATSATALAIESIPMLPVTEVATSSGVEADIRRVVSVAPVRGEIPDEVVVAVEEDRKADSRPVDAAAPASVRSERPSERSIAANLARLEQSEPELVSAMMSGKLSAPFRAQTASESVLETAREPSDRYQLIARYADHSLNPAPSAPVQLRERIARRLGDDLGDRISRIGVEGSRVSLKF